MPTIFQKVPWQKLFFDHFTSGRFPRWPLLMVNYFPELLDQKLKFWPFGLREGHHFQWSIPHIPFFHFGIGHICLLLKNYSGHRSIRDVSSFALSKSSKTLSKYLNFGSYWHYWIIKVFQHFLATQIFWFFLLDETCLISFSTLQ
jgi:hypothetical protein